MKVLLLTKKSAYQIYCANILHKECQLTHVIVEKGSSFAPRLKDDFTRKAAKVIDVFSEPRNTISKIVNAFNYERYFGNRRFHEERILGEDYCGFINNIECHNVEDVNSSTGHELIMQINPDFIFVFGTGMISSKIFEIADCPIINMHWGWSPDYRGEGIITAIAYSGTGDLGVTVHHLDGASDSGDIIYQARPVVDREDNFYSIGLKLSKIGTNLFVDGFNEYKEKGKLPRVKQDLNLGRLYSSKYMSKHPELYSMAWAKLKLVE
jgi:hypothetical protein